MSSPSHPENTAEVLGETLQEVNFSSPEEADAFLKRTSRRGFLAAALTGAAGFFGYRWLRQKEQNWIFEKAFGFNQSLSQAYLSPTRLAPQFSPEQVGKLRVNGVEGMSKMFDPASWRLQVVGLADAKSFPQYTEDISYHTAMDNDHPMRGGEQLHHPVDSKVDPKVPMPPPSGMDRASAMQTKVPGLLLRLADIQALPKFEMITEFKCVEGWSTIVHWGGARFADFAARYQPATLNGKPLPYASLVTPDGGYYVGWDMASLLHPQTLLCYEMNGLPLTLEHGGPLRLVSTLKYGIKQIKRIGRITFTDQRPADYWGDRGYDWYSGH